MAKTRNQQITDGETIPITMPVFYEQCCHCGLVHKVKYRVTDADGNTIRNARLEATFWQQSGHTAQARKKIKFYFA